MSTNRPDVLVLNVNETLSDLTPLRRRFEDAGLPGHSLGTWFAATLRDGFALTVAGATAEFGAIGADVLATQLSAAGIKPPSRPSAACFPGSPNSACTPMLSPGCGACTNSGYGS